MILYDFLAPSQLDPHGDSWSIEISVSDDESVDTFEIEEQIKAQFLGFTEV